MNKILCFVLLALVFGCNGSDPPEVTIAQQIAMAVENAPYKVELLEVSRFAYYVQSMVDSGETFIAAGSTSLAGVFQFEHPGERPTKFLMTDMALGIRAVLDDPEGPARVIISRRYAVRVPQPTIID